MMSDSGRSMGHEAAAGPIRKPGKGSQMTPPCPSEGASGRNTKAGTAGLNNETRLLTKA